MKKINVDEISLMNFKGTVERNIDFGSRTFINGQNAVGKTTLVDAFSWLLFDKDSTGATKFQIRPLDEKGDPLHYLEIKVEAKITVDEKPYTLCKVQKEKWVKKRGCEEQEFQGNVNEYSINGYPKTEKEYKEFVADIVDEKLFRMITNPTVFNGMPWKEQREILFKLVDGMTDLQIALDNEAFAPLVSELEMAKLDDIRNKYLKSKNELNKKLIEIPSRIDEVARQIVYVDVAELELKKKALQEQIAELRKQLTDMDAIAKKHKEKADNILHLKFQLSDLQREAEMALNEKRSFLKNELSKKNLDIVTLASNIDSKKRFVENSKKELEEFDRTKVVIKDAFIKAQERVFDDSNLVCSYCGQEFPAEKKEELREEFESHKADELKRIIANGKQIDFNAKELEEKIAENEKHIEQMEADLGFAKEELVQIELKIDTLPTVAEIDPTAKAELEKQIADAEKAMYAQSDADDDIWEINHKIDGLTNEVNNVNIEISKADCSKAEERKKELEAEQIEVGQKVANCEKMLFMVDNFTKLKLDLISNEINRKFEKVNWLLFKKQINGGIAECCECTFNGVPISALNSGHRIVAGLDIIRTLSSIFGISAPVFVDNAETINEYNIPDYETQLILLRVTDDREMKVEVKKWS